MSRIGDGTIGSGLIGDPLPPTLVISTLPGKISNKSEHDHYDYSVTASEPLQAWEARIVSSGSAARSEGVLIDSGGAVANGVVITGSITFAELFAAGVGTGGIKTLKFFGRDVAGNWNVI